MLWRLGLSLIPAFLYYRLFPPYYFYWLAFLFLVPWFWSINRYSLLKAFLTGWLNGWLAFIFLLSWIIVTLETAGTGRFIAVLGWGILSLYLGLYWGLFALFSKLGEGFLDASGRRNIFYLWSNDFCLSAFWVLLEYLRSYLFTGFPWGIIGYTQSYNLPILQFSEVGGVYIISFLIILANRSFFSALFFKGRLRQRLLILFPVVFIGFGVYGWGEWRLAKMRNCSAEKSPERIVLIQGNIDQYKKWDKTYVTEIEQVYAGLSQKSRQQKPRLIIWPETAVPGYLRNDPEIREWFFSLIRNGESEYLIGSAELSRTGKAYNSAFLYGPPGILRGIYRKQHLLPFGEYFPGRGILESIVPLVRDIGDFSAGLGEGVLNSSVGRLGVHICYEAVFPEISRRRVKAGATILVNLTNDAWFLQTNAAAQHFAFNIFRAVENRVPLLRAANTGISAYISPSGKVVVQRPIFVRDILVVDVPKLTTVGKTVYNTYSDWFVGFLSLCLLMIMVKVSFRTLWRRKDGIS